MSERKLAGKTGAIVCGACVVVAIFVHAVASRVIGSSDLLEGLLVKLRFLPLLALFALFAARLFLYWLAPGWVLFVLLRFAVERGRLRPP